MSTVYNGYANPLAGAHVTAERIDQGVDYTGTGTYDALGAGTITQAGVGGTGWPGHGGFIEELLSSGPLAGRTFYYAEGVDPAAGIRVGSKVAAGQPIANLSTDQSTGTELGFGGPGTATFASTHGGGSGATAAGVAASNLIHKLGGPAGVMEGSGVTGTAPGLTSGGSGSILGTIGGILGTIANPGGALAGGVPGASNAVNSAVTGVGSDITGAVSKGISSALSSLFDTIVSKAKYAALVAVLVIGGFVLMGKGISRTTHAGG